MEFLNDLLKAGAAGTAGAEQPHPGMSVATGLVEMLCNGQSGGLQGLVQGFSQNGLGGIVASWVGTGANQPVTGSQVHSALGSEVITTLAQRAGVSPEMASSLVAQVLPGIVDKLTPNGSLPESGNLGGQLASLLQGLKF